MILRIPIGAFLLNQDSINAVEALKEDRFFFRSTIEIHQGGIDAAATQLADIKTPTLLIVETSAAFGQGPFHPNLIAFRRPPPPHRPLPPVSCTPKRH